MNDTEKQLQIDRMVDGELSANDQRQLLLMCDSENRWRELALAYVESQVFSKELHGFSQQEQSPVETATGPALVSVASPSEKADGSIDSGDNVSLAAPKQLAVRQGQDGMSGRGWNVMSLAAVVLLSLGFGYGLGWWLQPDPEMTNSTRRVAVSDSNASTIPNVAQASPNQVETMPFLVSDSTGSEMKQVNLPLVNASDLSPNWQEQLGRSDVPQDLLRELRSNGIKLHQQRTMTRVRLPDGRLVLVPIDYFYQELFQ